MGNCHSQRHLLVSIVLNMQENSKKERNYVIPTSEAVIDHHNRNMMEEIANSKKMMRHKNDDFSQV